MRLPTVPGRTLIARLVPALAVAGILAVSFISPKFGLPGMQLVASCGFSYGYGYGPTPVVTGISPNFGSTAGGTVVTISGSGFCNNTTAVSFGSTAATNFVLDDDSHIRATSPAEAAGTVDITVTTGNGTSPTSAADRFTFLPDSPGVFTPRSPTRLLDTRNNGGKLGPGGSVDLQVGGISVPANATAVVINVTATDTTTAGFFTVFPTGGSLPTASNLNWVAGETVANLVFVKLGSNGSVTIYNGLGSADAVVDLEGSYAANSGGSAGEFVPRAPARITDTRAGSGQPNAGLTLGPNSTLDVQVAGLGGVPLTGAAAVVLNVTVTDTTAASFITAYPTGSSRPNASNLNWTAGRTVPNRVVVMLGTAGKVTFYNGFGNTDLIVDVNGYITDSTAGGVAFFALSPSRIVDTRNGTGGFSSPLGPGATMVVTVAGSGGVPASGATAVVINVTVANPTAASALIVYPDGTSQPTASDLNFIAGQTVPNLVVVKLSAGGKIDITNLFGSTNVIVDVVGWFGS